jgi:hypothetical protein
MGVMLFILIMDGTIMWLDAGIIANWKVLADVMYSVDKQQQELLEHHISK